MLEHITTFTPADGSAPRTITLRIGDPRPDPQRGDWTVAVDILGFADDLSVRLPQADWPSAIQTAARFISTTVTWKVEKAGGGTLDPDIFPVQLEVDEDEPET